MIWIYTVLSLVVLAYLAFGFRVFKDYEQVVVFTLGKYYKTKNGGLRWILPFIQNYEVVPVKVRSLDLGEQELLSKEGFKMIVKASVSYKVVNAKKAVNDVEDHVILVKNSSLSSIKNVVSSKSASLVLTDRSKVLKSIVDDINKEASDWGVKVNSVQFYDLRTSKDFSKKLKKSGKKLEVEDNDDFLLD